MQLDEGFLYYIHKRRRAYGYNVTALYTIRQFTTWLEDCNITPEQLRYQDIMDYVDYCRSMGNKHNTISGKLRLIRFWCDYRYIVPNPCNGWYLKRRPASLPGDLLTEGELSALYDELPEHSDTYIRNKCIMSLVIYQGLATTDLKELRIPDVRLEIGYISIKKRKRANARNLKINPHQISVLTKYISEVRPAMLLGKITDRLIIHRGKTELIHDLLQDCYSQWRQQHPSFKNAKQIRSSVIANWLKSYNLREVQYMAGHKYVSSTERYLQLRIEDLQRDLDQYHPLR